MSCPTCQIVDCVNPSDFGLYNLNDGTIFTNPRYAFVMDCPPGYACHGNYPITIVIDGGTIHLPVPPNPTVIRLACCQSEIVRNVPANATAADIAAIAAEVVRLCAAQQAACDARTNPPGPGLPPPTPVSPPDNPTTRTDLWNTKQQVSAECGSGNTGTVTSIIPARTYAVTLYNATAAQIVTQQTALNTIAMQQAVLNLAGLAPLITSAAIPSGVIATAYSFSLSATGGTTPYTFRVISGALPTGLAMDGDGNITGTPTTAQTTAFTVGILDAVGNECDRAYTLEITASNPCPVIIASPLVSESYYNVMCYDPVNDRIVLQDFNARKVAKFNPITNLEDGALFDLPYPGGSIYIPATTLTRTTTASFTAPAVSSNVQITIGSTIMLVPGQAVTIVGKAYQVVTIDSAVLVTLKNINDTPTVIHGIGTTATVAFSGAVLYGATDNPGDPTPTAGTFLLDVAAMTSTRILDVAGSMLYCSDIKKLFVGRSVLNVETGLLVNILSDSGVYAGYKPSANEVYITSFIAGNTTVQAIDTTSYAITKSYIIASASGLNIQGIYCPTSDSLYVGYGVFVGTFPLWSDKYVKVIHATTFTEAATILIIHSTDFVGVAPQVAYCVHQNLVYVQQGGTWSDVAQTALIDPATNTITCTLLQSMAFGVDVTSKGTFYSNSTTLNNLIETQ